MNVVAIVEGDGEVQAVPVLLRRIAQALTPGIHFDIAKPIRVRRDRFLNRRDEFERTLTLARRKLGGPGWVLVLLDADDDCPAERAPVLMREVADVLRDTPSSVVFANREFEAWFIASAASLAGCRGFMPGLPVPPDPDSIRGAKEWISRQVASGSYKEVADQPAYAQQMDLAVAEQRSRSFRKLCADWRRHSRSPL